MFERVCTFVCPVHCLQASVVLIVALHKQLPSASLEAELFCKLGSNQVASVRQFFVHGAEEGALSLTGCMQGSSSAAWQALPVVPGGCLGNLWSLQPLLLQPVYGGQVDSPVNSCYNHPPSCVAPTPHLEASTVCKPPCCTLAVPRCSSTLNAMQTSTCRSGWTTQFLAHLPGSTDKSKGKQSTARLPT